MLHHIAVELVKPLFLLFLPQSRFCWLYLLSSLLIALTVCYWRQPRDDGRSALDAAREVFPRQVYLHPSALLDYRFALINHVIFALTFGTIMVSTVVMTDRCLALLHLILGDRSAGTWPGPLASVVFTVCLLLAVDGGLFLAHWLQHKLPVLWEFHKVHHAAEVLTPVTDLRMHPIDTVLSVAVQSSLLGLVNSIFLYIYAGPVAELTVVGANALGFVLYLAGYHLKHSHVWILYPRGLREVISSPALHLIHHSKDPKHFDKNFARFFTFWDRLAGTLYVPAERENLEFGLGDKDQRELRTVWQLYTTPFRNVFARLRRQAGPARRSHPAR